MMRFLCLIFILAFAENIIVSFRNLPEHCSLFSVSESSSLVVSLDRLQTHVGNLFSLECFPSSFGITSDKQTFRRMFAILPGKHIYHLNFDLENDRGNSLRMMKEESQHPSSDPLKSHLSILRVVSSYGALYCPGRFHFEPVWRDAIRAAARIQRENDDSKRLCFCGAGNESSSFSIERPDPFYEDVEYNVSRKHGGETLELLSSFQQCRCDLDSVSTTFAKHSDASHSSQPVQAMLPYNLVLPCHHGSPPGSIRGSAPKNDIFSLTNCASFDVLSEARRYETRVFWINDVCHGWSRLVLKSRLWYSLRAFYGLSRAQLIMPRSYDLKGQCKEDDLFCEKYELLSEIGESKPTRQRLFIVKDPFLHKQKGIALTSDLELLDSLDSRDNTEFSFVTEYVPNPFLVNQFKVNMRRYVLLVCNGKRARAFVHDDGKNFYGKQCFSEPWSADGELKWNSNSVDVTSKEHFLAGIVTTGYNLTTIHDLLPVTSSEFIHEILSGNESRFSQFRKSMSVRLALAIHMAATKFALPSERSRYLCEPHETPSCLLNAIRFIHLGCDFHVDLDLTGRESRMFECNLSPDFHIRDERDGKIKQSVAIDFMSFIGLEGSLNDNQEYLRRFHMQRIYDSDNFDEEEHFRFLQSLVQNESPLDEFEFSEESSQFYADLK